MKTVKCSACGAETDVEDDEPEPFQCCAFSQEEEAEIQRRTDELFAMGTTDQTREQVEAEIRRAFWDVNY